MSDWDFLLFSFRFPETYLLLGLYGLLAYRLHRRLMRRPYRSFGRAIAAGLVFWGLFFVGLGVVLAIDFIVILFHVMAVARQPL